MEGGWRWGVEDLVPGSQLLVDYDWRLSTTTSLQHAFSQGSTSPTETLVGDKSRWIVRGGRHNGGQRSQRG
jgi:hypothetical protein